MKTGTVFAARRTRVRLETALPPVFGKERLEGSLCPINLDGVIYGLSCSNGMGFCYFKTTMINRHIKEEK